MKNMRDEMPATAAKIDELRREYGLLPVDRQIRRAMKGEPVFYAKENGHQLGTKGRCGTVAVWWDEQGISQVRPIVEPDIVLQITLPSFGLAIEKSKDAQGSKDKK